MIFSHEKMSLVVEDPKVGVGAVIWAMGQSVSSYTVSAL